MNHQMKNFQLLSHAESVESSELLATETLTFLLHLITTHFYMQSIYWCFTSALDEHGEDDPSHITFLVKYATVFLERCPAQIQDQYSIFGSY